MAFPPSLLDEIRARIPVSEVVGRKVQWDRRKTQASRGDYWACCPFHAEKTPSFHADDRKGRYHCFGCQAGGDIFTFLTATEGLSFPEAVEALAGQAGLEVPKADPRSARREEARTSLYEVMEKAARFFEASLAGKAGREAAAYLERRGLTGEAIRRFRLGYAPNARHGLKEHLAGAGVTTEQMVEAGLLVSGDDIAVPFDRFRERVMFPIPDSRGRIIAFGGRALSPDAQAKYLNSPETPLFAKRTVLYNYAAARKPAQDRGTVIVAEGYMDVIALAMAGFENAVAALGTALTERQLQLLWRLAPEPVLCFDGDEAGQRAALRAVETALPDLKPGYSLRFAFLPEGQDPDDFIRNQGVRELENILEAHTTIAELLWDMVSSNKNMNNPSDLSKVDFDIDVYSKHIKDAKVRYQYVSFLRKKLATERFQRKIPKKQSNEGDPEKIRTNISKEKSGDGRRAAILKSLVCIPQMAEEFEDAVSKINFDRPDHRKIFGALMLSRERSYQEESRDGILSRFMFNIEQANMVHELLNLLDVSNEEAVMIGVSESDRDKEREKLVGNLMYIHQIEGLGDELYEIESEIGRGNFESAMDRIYAAAREFAGVPNRDFIIIDWLGRKYLEENIQNSRVAAYKRRKAEEFGQARRAKLVA